jgi:hypothetical protein
MPVDYRRALEQILAKRKVEEHAVAAGAGGR